LAVHHRQQSRDGGTTSRLTFAARQRLLSTGRLETQITSAADKALYRFRFRKLSMILDEVLKGHSQRCNISSGLTNR
jgi:hypothetical protein